MNGALPTLLPILLSAGVVALAAVGFWIWLARSLAGRFRSRLRALPLVLPVLLAALGYALYWIAFFASPAMAVQMHAIRLTIAHAVGPYLPFVAVGWLILSLLPLAPLLRR
ncbi:MAG: hypothetical protein ACRCTI_19830 [Beijerinckiaceae bacterium]